MAEWIGIGRRARRAYGFEEIAIVPGKITIDPEEVDISWEIGGFKFQIPIIASAMDGVMDTKMAILMTKLGGFGVLNLEGVQTRYENPEEAIEKIINAPSDEATNVIQKVYEEPIKEELIGRRIEEIKKGGGIACVSSVPQRAERFGVIAKEAGCDIFVVQSTVTTIHYISKGRSSLNFKKIKEALKIPIIVGNCVRDDVCLEFMEAGIDGILIGVGPGTACTTRSVLGVGIPQITATIDCVHSRDFYYKKTGKYIPIITDGGMSRGGDICKAFAAGCDAVMIGSSFTRAYEAPGKGYHWGMATPHRNLPRGTRIKTGIVSSLEAILYGPAHLDDGSQNLIGALRTAMGICGAKNIKEMQNAELIIAPSIQTEGKIFQVFQRTGMGRQ
ncbi:TPA: GuaB3 family IMP dehydrogenase-related protein [bacterium]|nr:GuaB3 family IMP dehydrogenase-related protein [bacterium]